jgi:PAS domain S-box-containing protein
MPPDTTPLDPDDERTALRKRVAELEAMLALGLTGRARAETALEKETLRRRILMNQSRDGIVILGQDHKVVEANRSFADMLGYTPDEMLSLHTWDWEAVMDEAAIRAAFSDLTAVNTTFETVHRRKDGSTLDVEISAAGTMVLDEPLIMAVVRDVGERKRTQAALVAAKEQAEAASRTKSEFLANMSHEVRTPINGIMGMLQLMAATSLDAEQREYQQNALRSAKRLNQLLADILDLSKIESGKLPVCNAAFTLEAIRESVLELFALPAREKGLDLSFRLEPGVPATVVGDESRLRQILFNLVGNAVKFTPAGGVAVEVCALGGPDRDLIRLLFTVRDTGIGIDEALLATIFEPFVQGDGSYVRRYQGAGLGLAIVRRLSQLMGGDLSIESAPGEGTAVHVCLPFAPPAEAAATETAGPGPDPAGQQAAHILVAEDDEVNMRCILGILTKWGHAATGAENGREVLRMAGQGAFDLILMDIQMPVMDGVEATRRIRNGEAGGIDPHIPIVAMTAHAMPGDRETFLAAGMDGYVAKPMDVATLRRAIASALGRSGGGMSPAC